MDKKDALRTVRSEDFPVYFTPMFGFKVLKHGHGSESTGHYRSRKTIVRMKGNYYWRGRTDDVCALLRSCVSCTIFADRD